jgi:hypothetical protein
MINTMRHLVGDSRRILVAGAGGGYDVLGAVPLLADLEADGREVHLASLSFTYLDGLPEARLIRDVGCLYEVTPAAACRTRYCPEAWLSGFLAERTGAPRSIWSFPKVGARPLARAYEWLIRELSIDLVVLVDGGIDAILRGDEARAGSDRPASASARTPAPCGEGPPSGGTSLGTPSEDLTSVAAVHATGVPARIACLGLGAELRDGIAHEQVFARIAELTRAGGYLGANALVPGTPRGDLYRDAVAHVFAHQDGLKQSHVHQVVVAAMGGDYGTVAPHVWLSALLNMYWWFDLAVVARTHLFLRELAETDSIWDVAARIEAIRKDVAIQPRTAIPL